MKVKVTFDEITLFDEEEAGWGRATLNIIAGDEVEDDEDAWMTNIQVSVPLEVKQGTTIEDVRKAALGRAAEVFREVAAKMPSS